MEESKEKLTCEVCGEPSEKLVHDEETDVDICPDCLKEDDDESLGPEEDEREDSEVPDWEF